MNPLVWGDEPRPTLAHQRRMLSVPRYRAMLEGEHHLTPLRRSTEITCTRIALMLAEERQRAARVTVRFEVLPPAPLPIAVTPPPAPCSPLDVRRWLFAAISVAALFVVVWATGH